MCSKYPPSAHTHALSRARLFQWMRRRRAVQRCAKRLMTNSTKRTPATDMYNTTNGRARNDSATCCTTNLPHRHVKMLGCGIFLSVGGEFVVQHVVELL